MIVAIDGTCCSGKSTASKNLSKKLEFVHLNTGLIYRAFAYKCIKSNIVPPNTSGIIDLITTKTKIETKINNGETAVVVDGALLGDADLRTPKINAVVPLVAEIPQVRAFARTLQRKIGESCENVIVEGRDICSVVFPDADIKFFVTADLDVRAQRHQLDYIKMGKNVPISEVKAEIIERDKSDTTREDSPLVKTDDAVTIDTSFITPEQVVLKMCEIVKSKIKNQ